MQALPSLKCSKSFKLAFQNYAKFNGRARRSEFFYFYLTLYIISFIIFIIIIKNSDIYYDDYEEEYHFEIDDNGEIFVWILIVIRIITFLPLLGLMVRRLHDIGRSGFYVLINFIPFVGEIILIFLWSIDSKRLQNEYGPSPKYIMPSGNLFPENNYIPPHNIYAQSGPTIIPVNQNQNQISPKSIPNPQQDSYLYQGTSNIPQNHIAPESMNIPQPYNNILSPSDTPYSNVNPSQQSSEYYFDPYSKPNPNQSSSDNYYNSSVL